MQYISRLFRDKLAGRSDEEIRSLLRLVLEELTGLSYTELVLRRHEQLPDGLHDQARQIVRRLLDGEPIQYILGKADFDGWVFRVNRHVLIPRPETEELVAWASNLSEPDLSVLDIGTGSGCIAISLKKRHPQWQVSALDVSEQALETARLNARQLQTDIRFFAYDILRQPAADLPVWDVMVSNPPYVCQSEQKDMERHVTEHEPHTALFVPDDDPLRFYRSIARFAQKHLRHGGHLFLEINRRYGQETEDLLRRHGFSHIERKPDMYGNERMVHAVGKYEN